MFFLAFIRHISVDRMEHRWWVACYTWYTNPRVHSCTKRNGHLSSSTVPKSYIIQLIGTSAVKRWVWSSRYFAAAAAALLLYCCCLLLADVLSFYLWRLIFIKYIILLRVSFVVMADCCMFVVLLLTVVPCLTCYVLYTLLPMRLTTCILAVFSLRMKIFSWNGILTGWMLLVKTHKKQT